MTAASRRPFTVCVAFYDCDSRATVVVDAVDYADACRRAIDMVDNGDVSTSRESYDPGATFAYGVTEGIGDPWAGATNVPERFADPIGRTKAEEAAPAMMAALRGILAGGSWQDDGSFVYWPDGASAEDEGAIGHAREAITAAEGAGIEPEPAVVAALRDLRMWLGAMFDTDEELEKSDRARLAAADAALAAAPQHREPLSQDGHTNSSSESIDAQSR